MSEVSNPFLPNAQAREVLTEVSSQRELGEVQAAIIMARRFPRDEAFAVERITKACQRKGLAEVAIYLYARGGTDITGPSIRLAEAIAQNWTNLQWGVKELEQRNGESTVESFCWDLETNNRQSRTFQVPHVRVTRTSTTRLKDPRDIYEHVANYAARRLRACILGIIPRDVVDEALAQCERTLAATIEVSEDEIRKMLEAFDAVGVKRVNIEQRIQRKLEAITRTQFIDLRKVYNSINDGVAKLSDHFQMAEPTIGTDLPPDKGNAALKGKLAERAAPEVASVGPAVTEPTTISVGAVIQPTTIPAFLQRAESETKKESPNETPTTEQANEPETKPEQTQADSEKGLSWGMSDPIDPDEEANGAEFWTVAQSETGVPVSIPDSDDDLTFVDPVLFARWLVDYCSKASAHKEAIIAHNKDAYDDAMKSPEAATILNTLNETPPQDVAKSKDDLWADRMIAEFAAAKTMIDLNAIINHTANATVFSRVGRPEQDGGNFAIRSRLETAYNKAVEEIKAAKGRRA